MSTQHGQHWLDRKDVGDVTVVRFRGPGLRAEEATRAIFHLLYGLVDEAGRRQLVLDLSAVESLDSLAIGKVVMLNRKAQAAGGRLALCGLTPGVEEVFETMHLQGVLDFYADERAALQSFLPPGGPEGSG